MEPKRVSATAVAALKRALLAIYWYKQDLKSFLLNCLSDKCVVTNVDWGGYKRQVVHDVVDALCTDPDRHLGDIRTLFHEVSLFTDFSHLERLEEGAQKAKEAREAVAALRALVEIHDTAVREGDASADRLDREQARLARLSAVRERLTDLRRRYYALIAKSEPQKRGFELERLLRDVFELFDLDPKASFRIEGEQIDGAFTFDSVDWLFEAKWQADLAPACALDAFAAKVRRKLDNTLGLFLSINGFSADGVSAHSRDRPVVVLMTGGDLMAVLEERVDFVDMLRRKRQYAGHTGCILIEVDQFDKG